MRRERLGDHDPLADVDRRNRKVQDGVCVLILVGRIDAAGKVKHNVEHEVFNVPPGDANLADCLRNFVVGGARHGEATDRRRV